MKNKINQYHVFVDNVSFGVYNTTNTKSKLKNEIVKSLKRLHPINASLEYAAEYRKRFENSTVYVYDADDYKSIDNHKHNE